MRVNINHFAFSGANMEQPTGTTADMFTRSAPWNAVSGRQQRQEEPHQAAVSSLKHVFSPRPIRGFFVSPPRNFLAAFQRQHVFVQSIGTPTQRGSPLMEALSTWSAIAQSETCLRRSHSEKR